MIEIPSEEIQLPTTLVKIGYIPGSLSDAAKAFHPDCVSFPDMHEFFDQYIFYDFDEPFFVFLAKRLEGICEEFDCDSIFTAVSFSNQRNQQFYEQFTTRTGINLRNPPSIGFEYLAESARDTFLYLLDGNA
ncbi:hypothetical protein GF386_01235 [Candidatus Pacearchaeota archaeon]|nr:hypothetical protein [Candidatus Pacearchaeota archaeon]